jgi:hypothetical protein
MIKKHYKILMLLSIMLFQTFWTSAQTFQISGGTQSSHLYNLLYTWYAAPRSQRLATHIPAAQLAAGGLTSGAVITSLELEVLATNTLALGAGTNVKFYLENRPASSLDLGSGAMTWDISNAVAVYDGDPSIILGNTGGWKTFQFGTGGTSGTFTYTGGAIVVLSEYVHTVAIGGSTALGMMYATNTNGTPTPNGWTNNSTKYSNNSTTTPPATMSTSTSNHPHLRLNYSTTPCSNPPTPGLASSNPSGTVCPGSPIVLSLTGNSTGLGMTFEWEMSTNGTSGWTSLSTAQASSTLSFSPTTNAWYRCKVVCSGGTPVYSDTIQVSIVTPLNGTYSINSANPTTGTNFATFGEAIDVLNCAGVSGPVTFNVAPNSGPYNERLVFGEINGTSAANTVTINGAGNTVSYATTTSERIMLVLNGTKYLKIDDLVFSPTGTTYGWGANIYGGAQYDTISNCTFNITASASTTSSYTAGIAFSGSNTTVTTAGNAKYCAIINNQLNGPTGTGGMLHGIVLTSGTDSNLVAGNTVANFYSYGIYNSAGKGNLIKDNTIHRAAKTSVSTFYGIYLTGAINGTVIESNRIHTPGGTATSATSTAYGLYLSSATSTATEPFTIANNIVYNINQGGVIYGLYGTTATNGRLYHNTINIDQAFSSTSATYGIYLTGTNTGTEVKNNLVSITAGTSGTKYGFYYSSAASVGTAQKNNFYVNSTQSGTQNYGYYTTAYASQATFQTAYPTLEVNAPAVDPQFVNAAAGNFMPANPLLAASGENLLAIVPNDILGNNRGALSTPGAYEMPSANGPNAGLINLINPDGIFCAIAQDVAVTVLNSGSVPLTNFQIQWQLNGLTQTPYTYTGTLDIATGSGQYMDTVTLGNVVIPAGNNTIKAWVIVPGDVNNADDTLLVNNITPSQLITAAPLDTFCAGSPIIVSLQPGGTYPQGSLEWESSTNGTTWTTIPNANNVSESFTGFSSNTSFRAKYVYNGATCYATPKEIVVVNPTITSTIADTICGSGTATLTANAGAGTTIKWFDAPTGGIELHTGNTFTTPNITTTTTYYANAAVGSIIQYAGLPTPIATTGNSGFSDLGIMFNALSDFTIGSVDVYPISTSSTSGTVTIALKNAAGTTLQTVTAPVTVSAAGALNTIPLNFIVTPGTGYRLVVTAATGMSSLIRESSGLSYPYTLPGVLSMTSGYTSGASQTYYYYLYNWQIITGCEGARVPVTAVVNAGASVDLGSDVAICPGASTTLDATVPVAGATYSWNTNASTPTISVSTPGIYSVIVNAAGCTSYDTIEVTTAPSPTQDLTDTVGICAGNSATLDAGNAGSTFDWTTGATTQTITTNTAGWHKVTITNGNNCTAEDSTFVVINQLPIVDLGNDTAICPNANYVLDAGNAGAAFLWSTGESTQTIIPTQDGTYSVVVTDENGCEGTDEVMVAQFDAALVDGFNFTQQFDIQLGQVAFAAINPQFVDEYLWDFGDGSTSTQANPTHVYQASGNYTVQLTVTNDCGSNDTSITIAVDLPTGVKAVNGDNLLIDVFPVPAKDALQVATHALNNKLEYISIVNALGQQVQFEGNINQASTTIYLNKLSNGNYYLKIKTKQGETIKKFSILK